MNFALIGYGKMGKTIETMGKEQGHSFPLIIDVDNREDLSAKNIRGIDAAIEFTIPSSAPGNVKSCIELGVPVVSGTTGWNEKLEEMKDFCREKDGTFLHASNFSIGVNVLFAMNRKLASIMGRFPQYRASMEEVHHIHKLDAPSGTAITLADQILEEHGTLQDWVLGKKAGATTLPVLAIREGEVKGRHSIIYESDLDCLSLSHDARSRDAFASGVFLAACYAAENQGVHEMSAVLDL